MRPRAHWSALVCELVITFRLHEGLAVVGVGLEDLHERQEFVGGELFNQLASVGVEVDACAHFSPHGV